MKRYLSLLCVLVLVFSLVAGGVLLRTTPVKAATLTVPGSAANITAAIAAASPGDTILVAANVTDNYTENIVVNKNNLTIQGAGSGNTTVEAADPNQPVFTVSANNTTIKYFTITGATNSNGIRLDGSNCQIDSDNISGNKNGIWITGNENRVRRNTITGNSNYGIRLPGTQGWNQVWYNNIQGNTNYGVFADPVQGDPHYRQWAGFNYWGAVSGPSGDGPGTGDPVNQYVWYNPWLNDSYSTILASGIADISMAIPLKVGWNTLSTPLALAADSNNWNEIVTNSNLADFQAFVYVPGTGWVELTAGDTTPLYPMDAVFIKKWTSEAKVIFKVSTLTNPPPTKTLSAGWNLIGSSMAITERELEMWKVLKSVDQTSAGLVGYIMVVSPPLATQPSWVYVRGQEGTAGTEWADWNKMDFGRGYWIYMENADEMAGVSSTPITARVWD